MSSPYSYLTSLDLYYFSVSANIFLYGYLIVMIIGFIGNIFQILTFSRQTMRNVSTGVLFLTLSISDTIYLCICFYVLLIYGFGIADRTDSNVTCKLRHFISNFSTNFSAWTLTIITADRWIRSRFGVKAQRLCTPRVAIYWIIFGLAIDFILNCHMLTPMFGKAATIGSTCGALSSYPTYSYFYIELWPTIALISVTVLPAVCMLFFVIAIGINVRASRNRVVAVQGTNMSPHERRRAQFLQQQMLILMLATLLLFFLTTCPVAVFRFAMSTLGIQTAYSLSLLLAAIFGLITTANYAFNFYIHCLSSKLFRKEFLKLIPCTISVHSRRSDRTMNVSSIQRGASLRQPPGTITQLIGQASNTRAFDTKRTTRF